MNFREEHKYVGAKSEKPNHKMSFRNRKGNWDSPRGGGGQQREGLCTAQWGEKASATPVR